MKPRLSAIAFWLVTALSAPVENSAATASVDLNGVVAVGGLRCAVLALDQGASQTGRCFVLSEGETQHGVRLMAVNEAQHSVQIEFEGKVRVLRLHGAPDAAAITAAMAGASKAASAPDMVESRLVGREASEPVNTALIPGNPGWGTLPPLVPVTRSVSANSLVNGSATTTQPVNSTASSSTASSVGGISSTTTVSSDPTVTTGLTGSIASNSGSGSTAQVVGNSSSGTGVSNTGQSPAIPDWVLQACQQIEAERAATAAQVEAGEMTPLPRTPLTKPGTPGNLVDNVNGVYSNYDPNFLSEDFSQM